MQEESVAKIEKSLLVTRVKQSCLLWMTDFDPGNDGTNLCSTHDFITAIKFSVTLDTNSITESVIEITV